MGGPGSGGSAGVDLTKTPRWASLLYALVIAIATLAPSSLAEALGIGTEGGLAEHALSDVLGYLAAAIAAGLLIVIPWRLRLAKRLGVSWPLFLCALGYVVGMAYLASEDLRQATYELIVYDLPDWPEEALGEIDPQHAAGYTGLCLLAGLAWRERLHPVLTGGIVFAFGLLLEGLQEMVPGREPTPKDLTSNAMGVLVGYVGIGLLALIGSEPGRDRPVHRGRTRTHRRHSYASRRGRRSERV
jgi:hypothetical protein